MKLPKFEVEQWMTDYEHDAVYNLTDTCIPALTFEELCALDHDGDFRHVLLDYGTITGDLELKQEILKLYTSGTVDNITLSQGCLQGSELVMMSLLEPGDHVIAYVPGYQAFYDYPASLGCAVTKLPLYEERGWQPDPVELKEAMRTPTKLIILNLPGNPTGSLFEESYLNAVFALAEAQGTYVLCDEIYRDPRIPSISDRYERGISVSSLSKMYALAGLRLGWIKGPQDLIHTINERRDYSIISTGPLVDHLGIVALKHSEELLNRSRKRIEEDKAVIEEWLKEEKRCQVVLPAYGTVSFLRYEAPLDSRTLGLRLLHDYGVFLVPGSCFEAENHFRLSLTCPPDLMREGLKRISECLNQL
ncbi:MAG: aminotransferase class I/II-fold pyridoxal phosphate-dependent enzyme [Solobacterium sp.]|nr:aminotransferase class I/II-fold pyridoxal phosphate-dependent enzyme [Solobacterium sp.]